MEVAVKKNYLLIIACLTAFLVVPAPLSALAEGPRIDTSVLSGTAKLACEAILCLSSSARPGECTPSLNHYFDIKKKKWSDTVKARKNFLSQCPVMNAPGMPELRDAIVDGAGFCDASKLNANTYMVYRYRRGGGWGPWMTTLPEENGYYGEEDGNGYYRRYESKRIISNQMPSRCLNYMNHDFTDFETLRYHGDIYDGGHWVEQ